MNFMIISPTAGLQRYATLSKHHMVLAHIHDPKYMQFYRERRALGEWLLLDNGAYETGRPMETKELCKQISYYKPQVVVLPDYPEQPYTQTLRASADFLKHHAKRFPEVEWMFVPQAPKWDLAQWYSAARAMKGLEVSWVGLSRIPAMLSNQPHIRMVWAQFIREHYPKLKMHALGMLHGDYRELYYLDKLGVSSIDSSAPVWRGWHAHFLDDQWDGLDVNFNAQMSTWPADLDRHQFILRNLEACHVRTTTR